MKIIFRADGDHCKGLGHIIRSSALMQILQPHFPCEFWTRNPDFFPFDDFAEIPYVRDLSHADPDKEAQQLSEAISSEFIVVADGYHFDTNYQKIVKASDAKLVCIDDIMNYHFVADAVINHAGGLDSSDYSSEKYTRFFLGPHFALIRPLFYRKATVDRNAKERKVIIALGGADPNNDTDFILSRMESFKYSEVHVILGAANPNAALLQTKYKNKPSLQFHRNLSGQSVYQLMMICTEAVLTPSTVCYEYMTVGGAVYLHQIADNQERIKQFFLREKLAFSFSDIGYLSNAAIDAMRVKQQQVFDGKSPERLVKLFLDIAN